jgi:hypothetical protein|tara:strand:+ start:65 stop:595 length:531 start_codon:yes stop_codon:yes gene_type:complete
MTNQLETPDVYDRIRLACQGNQHLGRNLVLEYIDGYDEAEDKHHDEWRVIDLDTGEVFAKDRDPREALQVASVMTIIEGSNAHVYVREAVRYRQFNDVPLADKLRHINEHARDLEQDFKLAGDNRCPLQAAMHDYQQRYSHACWYQEDNGSWEIDMDVPDDRGLSRILDHNSYRVV